MSFHKNGQVVKKDIPWEESNVFRVTQGDTFQVDVDGVKLVEFNFAKSTFTPKA